MKAQGPRAPTEPRLRATHTLPPFHVVLHEPEIPPNTGSIARTCAATDSPLHLIEPLGFRIDEHAVRRAGLDYWPLVDLHVHQDFEAFFAAFSAQHASARIHIFTAHAKKSVFDVEIAPGDALLFGKESVGLPAELEQRFADTALAIPMRGKVRSLNLSNAVSIVLYECQRKSGMLDETYNG